MTSNKEFLSRQLFFLLAWVSLAWNSAAFAQTAPVVEIDKITIIAPRVGKISAPRNANTSIEIPEEENSTTRASDIISRTAGVHIQNYGGLEAATAISIRGSTQSQVEIFLDDIPLQSAASEGIGLEQVSADSLSRIEVYKSYTPTDFGVSAIGGAINLRSREIKPGFHHRYDLSFGSFTTVFGSAEASFGSEKNDLIFDLNYRYTKGDFTFLDNNGTPFNAADDARVERQNNESQLIHPYLKWEHRFDKRNVLTIANHFFRQDSGVPGLESFQSQNADRSLTDWLGVIKFKHTGAFDGKLNFQNHAYWRFIHSQFTDLAGEIGLGAGQDNDDRTSILGDRILTQLALTSSILLKNNVEYAGEFFSPKNYLAANPVGTMSTRHQINLAIEPIFSLWQDKLTIDTQVRLINAFYDINNNDPSLNAAGTFFSTRTEHPFLASLAAQWKIQPELFFKASIARAVRLPKFSEMFGDQGYILGNPQLTSEKAYKGDVGLLWQKPKFWIFKTPHAELNYFESHLSDLIQFELASGVARASNLGKAKIQGIETILGFDFLKFFSLSQNYTWQRARDTTTSANNNLIGRPEHESNTNLSFAHKRFQTSFDLNFVDNQYLDALNTRKINNRFRLDAAATYQLTKNFLMGLELKNITGTQIVDAVGFPLPGRSVFGRVQAHF